MVRSEIDQILQNHEDKLDILYKLMNNHLLPSHQNRLQKSATRLQNCARDYIANCTIEQALGRPLNTNNRDFEQRLSKLENQLNSLMNVVKNELKAEDTHAATYLQSYVRMGMVQKHFKIALLLIRSESKMITESANFLQEISRKFLQEDSKPEPEVSFMSNKELYEMILQLQSQISTLTAMIKK